MLDSTAAGPVSADNWLAGFGYSSPTLFKVFTQAINAWGPVETSDMGAVMAKVTENAFLAEAELNAKAEMQAAQPQPYAFAGLYQEWLSELPKTAKVQNKMDMVFRN